MLTRELVQTVQTLTSLITFACPNKGLCLKQHFSQTPPKLGHIRLNLCNLEYLSLSLVWFASQDHCIFWIDLPKVLSCFNYDYDSWLTWTKYYIRFFLSKTIQLLNNVENTFLSFISSSHPYTTIYNFANGYKIGQFTNYSFKFASLCSSH